MVRGLFHPGSGLGNQLHRYVATRVLAMDKGYDFGMIGNEYFKGSEFMALNKGLSTPLPYQVELNSGKITVKGEREWGEGSLYYNPEFNFVEDNTVIDGEFQDERYFEHRMDEIDQWLTVEPVDVPNDLCIINFRGGEFYVFPELGLPKEYFDTAMYNMNMQGINKFEVHTDDIELAKQFFPNLNIIRDIGINWRTLRYAKHAIISNSSFAILPRLLSKGITIAPRYWARRNTKEWSMPQNYYKEFQYV